jgi:eukaryotic-like serine/threonine-protein kinase
MPFDAMAHAGLARIALSRGDIVAARVSSNRALELIDRVQSVFDIRTRSQVWLVRSAVFLQDGQAAEANRWAEKARDASVRLDSPSSWSIVLAMAAMDRAADGAAR